MKNKFIGSILGLAVGDALGAPIEFEKRDTYTPITHMRDGGPFHLKAGQWTDDTSLALCMGMSLVEKKTFDSTDIMKRFSAWYAEGYMSCTGHCFDIGNTTKAALVRFKENGEIFAGSPDDPATNGSIMRLAPIPLFYAHDLKNLIHYSKESSRLTHAPVECLDACAALGLLIYRALHGKNKEEILDYKKGELQLSLAIEKIMLGSYKTKKREEISAAGLAVTCLEAALWAFYHSGNFKEGVLLAVNLGEDSDTTGAVYGQLAGAFYGHEGIDSSFLEALWDRKLLLQMAHDLYDLSEAHAKNHYEKIGVNETVDLVIFNPKNEILLIKRSLESQACPGMYALPGGFVDVGESTAAAAIRELQEETNLSLPLNTKLKKVGVYEGKGRDPRDNLISWSKSQAFVYSIDEVTFNTQKIRGMDDAIEARWIPVQDVLKMDLAFDHNTIIADALNLP